MTGHFLTRKKSVAQPEWSGNAEKTPSSPLPFYTVFISHISPQKVPTSEKLTEHNVQNEDSLPSEPQGLITIFSPLEYSKKPQGRNLKCHSFIQHFFKIVLYWCLDLIHHNIGTKLKLNKYIFDISIPFCHLSATLKQCFTEYAIS